MIRVRNKSLYYFFTFSTILMLILIPLDSISKASDENIESFQEEIIIADENLEKAIRENINKPEGTITKVDLEKLTSLNANGLGIKSLSGIEYAINLRELAIGLNGLSDITPLANLKELRWLGISNNNITDITALKELKKLEFLYAEYNKITDLSPLKNSPNSFFISLTLYV